MPKPSIKLIKDEYYKVRGKEARIMHLKCHRCREPKFIYQKDGPGPLKRLYLDRIHQGEDVCGICSNCHYVFGIPDIYEREKRPIIRLFVNSLEL